MLFNDGASAEDYRTAMLQLVDRGPNAESIRRMLHICRLKLGAALERIEEGGLAAENRTDVLRHVECLAFEVDSLLASFSVRMTDG